MISPGRSPEATTSVVGGAYGDVAVLLRRPGLALGAQGTQRLDHVRPGVRRRDQRVDVAALGSDVGVGQIVLVVLHQLLAPHLRLVAGRGELGKRPAASRHARPGGAVR